MKRLAQTLLVAWALGTTGLALAQEHEPVAGEHADQAVEHAEHEAEHSIDPKTLGLQLLNFGVLLFILVKFGGGAINKALAARHEQLKNDMAEAAKVRAAAEARFKEQEKRLANLEQEVATMRKGISEEAAHEKARIIAGAEEKARRVQDETRFQLEQQVKDAELRFRAEVARASLRIADELLRRSVTGSDDQRLVQTFVSGVAGREGPSGHGGLKS